MDHVQNEKVLLHLCARQCLAHLYLGYTSYLRKRFKEHNDGKSTYTKRHRSYKMIYYEACLTEDDARSREVYLKSGRGWAFIKSHLKPFLFCT